MRFGFFGSYQLTQTVTIAGKGYNQSPSQNYRVFYPFTDAYTNAINGNLLTYEYSDANTGNVPDSQLLLGVSEPFDGDARTRYAPGVIASGTFNIYYRYNTFTITPSSRIINIKWHYPHYVASIYATRNDGLGNAGSGTVLPGILNLRFPNLRSIVLYNNSAATNGAGFSAVTQVSGFFSPVLTTFNISDSVFESSAISVLPSKFPASLLSLATRFSAAVNVNTAIEDCTLLQTIQLTSVMLSVTQETLSGPAGGPSNGFFDVTFNLSHLTQLRTLYLYNSNLQNLTVPAVNNNTLQTVHLTGTPLTNTSFSDLLNYSFFSTDLRFINLKNLTRAASLVSFTDSASLLFTQIYLYGNYLYGNITFTSARTSCSTFKLGNVAAGITDSGVGKNATANSATAGALSREFGGAGGAGGSNADGVNGSNYGGGGGGAGRTSGDRNGGNGAGGHIRIAYITNGNWTYESFTTSGTFVVPSDVTEVYVECTGAGGGGGGKGTTTGGAGGGGGGAWSFAKITVIPSTSYNYTVGIGGSGGIGLTNGGDGGDTYWDLGVDCKAAGGKGGNAIQTGGAGGALVDSVGLIIKQGGDGSTKTTDVSPGGGGGGGAGSTGLKNLLPYVNITGLTNATTIDLSNSQIFGLELPVNTTIQNLYLGGNRLDTTVSTNLISQIQAMTNLRDLRFAIGSFATTLNNSEYGQDSANGIGTLDLSSLTLLTTFIGNVSKLTGDIILPTSLSGFMAYGNTLTGVSGVSNFPSLTTMVVHDNPSFDFDFTRVPVIRGITAYNTGVTILDLSARTTTLPFYSGNIANQKALDFSNCLNLTSVIFPTSQSTSKFSAGASGSGVSIIFTECSNLTSLTNHENINFDSVTNGPAVFRVDSCSLDIDLKFGINDFTPQSISCQNNGMSLTNVNLNIDNIYQNRSKWKIYTAVSKSLNISGTNAAPSGTYQAPTGWKQATITGITRASTAVVTVSAIGSLANDDVILIRSVVGMTQVNFNYYMIKNISGNTFELYTQDGVSPINSSAFTAYTSGGVASVEGSPASAKEQTYVLVNAWAWTITQN